MKKKLRNSIQQKSHRSIDFQGEQGSSLISVLVGIGLFSLVMMVGQRLQKGSATLLKHTASSQELELIKWKFLNEADCGLTAIAVVCPSSGYLTIKGKKGQDLTKASGPGKVIGDWTIRARCADSNDGLTIEVARVLSKGDMLASSDSSFMPDPVSGKSGSWKSLFPVDIEICSGEVSQQVPQFFPTPDYVSRWEPLANRRTINHNLGTKDYIARIEYSSGNWASNNILSMATMVSLNGNLSEFGMNETVISDLSSNSVTVETIGVYFSKGSYKNLNNNLNNHFRVKIWKTNP